MRNQSTPLDDYTKWQSESLSKRREEWNTNCTRNERREKPILSGKHSNGEDDAKAGDDNGDEESSELRDRVGAQVIGACFNGLHEPEASHVAGRFEVPGELL